MVKLPMTTNTQCVSTDTLLEHVANPRRRTILHRLRANGDDAVALDELTETIATDGGTAQVRHAPGDTRAAVELHHTHLPKLADAGLIEYDQGKGTVRYLPNDRLEALLEFVSTRLE